MDHVCPISQIKVDSRLKTINCDWTFYSRHFILDIRFRRSDANIENLNLKFNEKIPLFQLPG